MVSGAYIFNRLIPQIPGNLNIQNKNLKRKVGPTRSYIRQLLTKSKIKLSSFKLNKPFRSS